MSDFDPVPEVHVPVETPPALIVEAAPSSTEPPAVGPAVEVVETLLEEVADVPAEPALRMTAEGVILSKVVVSAEGIVMKVLD